MTNLTDAQLIDIGKQEVAKRVKQKEYDKVYLGRQKFVIDAYKDFAEKNGFKMPGFPPELNWDKYKSM